DSYLLRFGSARLRDIRPSASVYMPRSWQPLKVLIAAEQALTSLVQYACLSLIRAKSLPGSTPQALGHAVARDHSPLHREMADSSRELVGPDISASELARSVGEVPKPVRVEARF